MPNEETSPSLKSPEAKGRESLISFRDFLKAKADELGVRDRHRRRGDWLGAIHRLLDQIRDWLRESDPEGVLDIEPYEVSRTEQDLGACLGISIQVTSMDDQSVQPVSIRPQCSFAPIPAA